MGIPEWDVGVGDPGVGAIALGDGDAGIGQGRAADPGEMIRFDEQPSRFGDAIVVSHFEEGATLPQSGPLAVVQMEQRRAALEGSDGSGDRAVQAPAQEDNRPGRHVALADAATRLA